MNLGYVFFPLHHSALPKCRTTSLSKEQKIILSLLPFRKYMASTWSNLWAKDSNPSLKEKNHLASCDTHIVINSYQLLSFFHFYCPENYQRSQKIVIYWKQRRDTPFCISWQFMMVYYITVIGEFERILEGVIKCLCATAF